MDWKHELLEKYREELGCKNTGVCWCKVCANIERIIHETIEHIKNSL
jgi:hypothetical protein